MKSKLVIIIAIFIIILSMVETGLACPASNDPIKTFNGAEVIKTPLPGNIEKYSLRIPFTSPGYSVIAICIRDTDATASPEYPLFKESSFYPNWGEKPNSNIHKEGYFGLGRNTGSYNIPLNGPNTIDIFQADFSPSSPSTEKRYYHLSAPAYGACGPNNPNPDTCWMEYEETFIPEFPTVALPIAAVIGLVFFFQYRKKKEG